MAENNKNNVTSGGTGMSASQDSYRVAKLIRQGSRELARQYNTKKTRRER